MPTPGLALRVVRACERWGQARGFLWLVAGGALLATVSMSFPATAILVPAAMMASRRWWSVAIAGALGSALGATALLFVFHHLGWNQVLAWFPELAEAPHWRTVTGWLERYGVAALVAVSALPMPQTPAIAVLAVSRPEALPAFLAIAAGKGLRYFVVCGIAAHVPRALGGVWRHVFPGTGRPLDASQERKKGDE